MKSIRIGCGAGCSFDRIEPAEELIREGNLDYIVFECLAERTMADNMLSKVNNPNTGYTPMLRERMERVLKLALDKGTKIITNMGGSNIEGAVQVIKDVARRKNISKLKIGVVYGDDIIHRIDKYRKVELNNLGTELSSIKDKMISANVYLGSEGIVQALNEEVDLVLTGRVADACLFTAPIFKEFQFKKDENHKIGQAILLGHLLECAGQLTGGYFADPGYKDVEDLHKLGFPIAEMKEDGSFIVTKVKGSGGEVSERVCKEQLLYEITDPTNYITPDGILDMTKVRFKELDEDIVQVSGGVCTGITDSYKVNLGYNYGYMGEAEVSFGGLNSLDKAKLCEDIVRGRLELVGAKYRDIRFDYIGYNSLYKDSISSVCTCTQIIETRLRLCVRTDRKEQARDVTREIDYMYTNGPSGSSGLSSRIRSLVGIDSILIPKEDVEVEVKIVEV